MLLRRILCCYCCGQDEGHREHVLLPTEDVPPPEVEEARQANQAQIQKILETSDNTFEGITKILELSPSVRARCVIITKVLNSMRLAMDAKSTTDLLGALLNLLPSAERTELRDILTGLPAGVLGDEASRNSTRVLVDVYDDANGCVSAERSALSRQQLDQALAAADKLEQLVESLGGDGRARERLLATLVGPPLTAGDCYRIVLQQLLLSKLVPPDPVKRQAFLDELFT